MELKIEYRNMEIDLELQEEVGRMTTRLHDHHSQLMHIRVVLTKNVHHRNDAQVNEVRVAARLPRRRTFIARKSSNTFLESIRAAFEALNVEIATYCGKRSDRRAIAPAREPQRNSPAVA